MTLTIDKAREIALAKYSSEGYEISSECKKKGLFYFVFAPDLVGDDDSENSDKEEITIICMNQYCIVVYPDGKSEWVSSPSDEWNKLPAVLFDDEE